MLMLAVFAVVCDWCSAPHRRPRARCERERCLSHCFCPVFFSSALGCPHTCRGGWQWSIDACGVGCEASRFCLMLQRSGPKYLKTCQAVTKENKSVCNYTERWCPIIFQKSYFLPAVGSGMSSWDRRPAFLALALPNLS